MLQKNIIYKFVLINLNIVVSFVNETNYQNSERFIKTQFSILKKCFSSVTAH